MSVALGALIGEKRRRGIETGTGIGRETGIETKTGTETGIGAEIETKTEKGIEIGSELGMIKAFHKGQVFVPRRKKKNK